MVIKSIQKEQTVRQEQSLGKLKLDFSVGSHKNMQKAVTYLMKNAEPFNDLDLLKEALITLLNQNPTNVSLLAKSPLDLDLQLSGAGLDYTNYYSYIQLDDKGKEVTYYFDLNGKLPQGKNGTGWIKRSDRSKFYVYNGKRILSVYELYKRLIAVDESLAEYKNFMVQNILFKAANYAKNSANEQKLFEALIIAFETDNNSQLMQDYEKSQASDYAKAFMTKKNISDKVADRMKISNFLNHGFKFLELDNDIDLEKLDMIEKEWIVVYSKLPKFTKKPDLRFRKLGQHKASGLYYPKENCVCVDIRNIQSLIHELGHLYDYTLESRSLSLTEEFRPIIHSYRQKVDLLDGENYVQKKKSYYLTPTEVFARAFELYLLDKLNTSFLKSEEDYNTKEEYTCFDGNNRLAIENFFNNLLPTIK